jgi:hypothetical protein
MYRFFIGDQHGGIAFSLSQNYLPEAAVSPALINRASSVLKFPEMLKPFRGAYV